MVKIGIMTFGMFMIFSYPYESAIQESKLPLSHSTSCIRYISLHLLHFCLLFVCKEKQCITLWLEPTVNTAVTETECKIVRGSLV